MSPPELETSLRSYQEGSQVVSSQTVPDEYIADNIKVQQLIAAYRSLGHTTANLDPLGINDADLDSNLHKTLSVEHYRFNDPNVTVKIPPGTLFSGKGKSMRSLYDFHFGILYVFPYIHYHFY